MTRACPNCMRCVLMPVFGGEGKAGAAGECKRCGYMGPLHQRDVKEVRRWERVRFATEGEE